MIHDLTDVHVVDPAGYTAYMKYYIFLHRSGRCDEVYSVTINSFLSQESSVSESCLPARRCQTELARLLIKAPKLSSCKTITVRYAD